MHFAPLVAALAVAGCAQAIIDRTSISLTPTPSPPPPAKTVVFSTQTLPGGKLLVTQVFYTQVWTSMFAEVSLVPTGTVGLGTIQGTIGVVRPPDIKTITQSSS